MTILEFLDQWLVSNNATLGQIRLHRLAESFLIHHLDDDPADAALTKFHRPEDAREIAKYDAAGAFRPLKSAPTLKRGWLLELKSIAEVRHSLDYLYPAAVANWVHFAKRNDSSGIVPLRETLNRQTGMYRVTGLMTDAEALELVASACADGNCTRRILWPIAANVPLDSVEEPKRTANSDGANLPLLCCEACNILVAAARTVVKKRMAANAPKAE